MNAKVIPIQQLDDAQIGELAKLHKEVIHSLLSDLGLPFLEKYYRCARAEPNVIGLSVLSETDRPVGWVVGSPKPEELTNQLKRPLVWFLAQILRIVITKPLLVWQLVASARSVSTQLEHDQIELTYIGIAAAARRMGFGKKLIEEFVHACRSHYRSIVLSVEVENTNAIQLYTSFGFQIMDTLTEGNFQRYRMKLDL